MPYQINRFDGTVLAVLEDGTINQSTSIGLLGRNFAGYGEIQNENFLFLLENFAAPSAPPKPIRGQTWFDTINKVLNVYDGAAWNLVGGALVSAAQPSTPITGDLWFKSTTQQLFVYNGSVWSLIGPEGIEGFGVTKIQSTSIKDLTNTSRPAMKITVDGEILGIVTKDIFTANATELLTEFGQFTKGLTLASDASIKGDLEGNAATASKFLNPVRINGVSFDGSVDVTISATSTNALTRGAYLTGNNFDGSTAVTWAVDASPNNLIGKVVARDAAGNFSAGTVTADLNGTVYGNVNTVTGNSQFNTIQANSINCATFIGNLTGNANTASRLIASRTINGVVFDGSANITIIDDTKLDKNNPTLASGHMTLIQAPINDFHAAPKTYVDSAITAAINALEAATLANTSLLAPKASPILTGLPVAPTAAEGTNTTQIATTAFVQTATNKWGGSRKFVSTSDPNPGVNDIGSVDGDFWFKYQ